MNNLAIQVMENSTKKQSNYKKKKSKHSATRQTEKAPGKQ